MFGLLAANLAVYKPQMIIFVELGQAERCLSRHSCKGY